MDREFKATGVLDLESLEKQGKLIGHVKNLPNAVYHAGPGIGSSSLKKILKTPANYWYSKQHPNNVSTPAQLLGSAVHAMILEHDKYDAQYCVKPVGTDRRTKLGKEKYEAWQKANVGKTELPHEIEETARAMVEAVEKNERFIKMLTQGVTEVSFYSPGEQGPGVICRVRPDLYVPATGVLVDVKTTQDATKEAFSDEIHYRSYHMQAAYYMDTLTALGFKAFAFLYLAIDKEPPFVNALYHLDPDAIEAGRRLYKKALSIYAECLASNVWSGLTSEITAISCREWHLKNVNLQTTDEEF